MILLKNKRAWMENTTPSQSKMKTDTEILDWLIKQGPPGAAEGMGLNEEVWDLAYIHADDNHGGKFTDTLCVRMAINAAMEEGE